MIVSWSSAKLQRTTSFKVHSENQDESRSQASGVWDHTARSYTASGTQSLIYLIIPGISNIFLEKHN